jgi:hypothetical protein
MKLFFEGHVDLLNLLFPGSVSMIPAFPHKIYALVWGLVWLG